MAATYVFPLFLVGLWIVVLILFFWMHLPEPVGFQNLWTPAS